MISSGHYLVAPISSFKGKAMKFLEDLVIGRRWLFVAMYALKILPLRLCKILSILLRRDGEHATKEVIRSLRGRCTTYL